MANIRHRSDVANSLCSKKSIRDPLFMVMEQSKLCEGKDKFVRIVTATPEPMCVLASNQQLHDLVHFGTKENCCFNTFTSAASLSVPKASIAKRSGVLPSREDTKSDMLNILCFDGLHRSKHNGRLTSVRVSQ